MTHSLRHVLRPRSIAAGAVLALLVVALPARSQPPADASPLIETYIEDWIAFHPSEAREQGLARAIRLHEDRSPQAVAAWIERNRSVLAEIETATERATLDEQIDLRLLARQARRELDRWENDRPHLHALATYSEPIADALTPVVESPLLSAEERLALTFERLASMRRLAEAARAALRDGAPLATERGLAALEETAGELEAPPSETLTRVADDATSARLESERRATAAALRELVAHLRSTLVPRLSLSDAEVLGRERFARRLTLYTDSELTPEELAKTARAEIDATLEALAVESAAYWREIDPGTPVPEEPLAAIRRAFRDLEAHRPVGNPDYLVELRRYGAEIAAFVREHDLVTLPEHDTLSIELAPESSGAMARVGFVDPAPPFDPNPWTTWYLATIPDSFPQQERDDFWSSFNYHFKRFIVVHELYPGHYVQQKLLRENLHPVRILFPYEPFTEGWATFAERVVLEHGWADGDPLTRIAQLRKRLENANRAYTSVMAHCEGWSEDEVLRFSVDTSLVAPQFAKSLWGRLMGSPMQILTYMLVGIELNELYEAEKARLGDAFVVRDFMDTVLRTGPVPTDAIAEVVRASRPR